MFFENDVIVKLNPCMFNYSADMKYLKLEVLKKFNFKVIFSEDKKTVVSVLNHPTFRTSKKFNDGKPISYKKDELKNVEYSFLTSSLVNA